MSNPELILNLPRLLIPDHLVWIRSLEMTWKVHPFRYQEDDDSVLTDHDTFISLIQATPKIFPSLQYLFVSLQGDMFPDPERRVDKEYIFSDEAYNKVEEVVMKPMKDMLKIFDWLKIGVIGLPSSCYGPRKQRAMDAGIEVFESRHGMGETFWREVPGLQSKGYWIRLGHRDMGGGNYDRGACSMGFVAPPQEPLDCLYGNSLSPW
ncbi:RES domain-containing protein [Fusarium austroafricanum]|uniref:RES domain-containing protein n=1 Tax=Fusarium austroafricanum TaxID=2364996 RepID=A0A8H4JII9_9HYPO|nr:RES domain-containing protein [Fusarium austroafricanum]